MSADLMPWARSMATASLPRRGWSSQVCAKSFAAYCRISPRVQKLRVSARNLVVRAPRRLRRTPQGDMHEFSAFNPVQIIAAKRDGKTLAHEEIVQLIRGYVAGEIPDHQMAALAMAICLRGMTI